MKTRNVRRRQHKRYLRYLDRLPIAPKRHLGDASPRLGRFMARTIVWCTYDTWARDHLKLAPEVRQRGLYCPHGKRLMRPDPRSRDPYPPHVFVYPWQCPEPECTKARILADFEAEEREYIKDQWDEYRANQGI